jgi:hypothetical protein
MAAPQKSKFELIVSLSVVVLIVGLIVFLVIWFSGGSKDDKTTQDKIDKENEKNPATIDDAEGMEMANFIYTIIQYTGDTPFGLFREPWDGAYKQCVDEFKKLQNQTDYWILYKAFGQRDYYDTGLTASLHFWPAGKADLPTMTKAALPKDKIQEINDYFQTKSIATL